MNPSCLLAGRSFFRYVCRGRLSPTGLRTAQVAAVHLARLPVSPDPLTSLRSAWSKRLLDSGLVSTISTLASAPPLSDEALAPFLEDLRLFLQVHDVHLASPPLCSRGPTLSAEPVALSFFDLPRPRLGLFPAPPRRCPVGDIISYIPPCPVMHPPPAPDSTVIPLQRCDSAWESALDHPEVVDELLASELEEGWIKLVPGDDAELRRLYTVTAVGKLGLVLAEGRPPRLVVDSSVSGVTSITSLPNRSSNPTLADVFLSMQLSHSKERLVALILDVAKAHRRMLIRSADRGLLCFRHRQKLYQCLTLNFGARVSSFYWACAAGLLVRLIRRLIRVRHSAQIYVDDLLALLESVSAPLWASLVVIFLQISKVPMSWHKGALAAKVVWIGWELNLSHFCVRLDPAKFARLCSLLRQALSSKRCSTHLLERITGKLLWFSSLFRTFRPSLAPLYADQHAFLPTMTALQPDLWETFRASLSNDLMLPKSVGLSALLPPGSRLLRVGQQPVILSPHRDLCSL